MKPTIWTLLFIRSYTYTKRPKDLIAKIPNPMPMIKRTLTLSDGSIFYYHPPIMPINPHSMPLVPCDRVIQPTTSNTCNSHIDGPRIEIKNADVSNGGLIAVKAKLNALCMEYNLSRSFVIKTLLCDNERMLLERELEERIKRMTVDKARGFIIKQKQKMIKKMAT